MRLKVLHLSSDYTIKMADLNSPATSLNVTSFAIYLGFYKPLKSIYVEMVARTGITDSLTVETWQGSAFGGITKFTDETMGLTKSGHIKIEEGVPWLKTDFDSSGTEMYWLKIKPGQSPVEINGINVLLSSDSDLGFIPNVADYLPEGKTSFVAFHQEARDTIVQTIRNSGKQILRRDKDSTDEALNARQISQFDLLDIEEFRNASKYLALALLFEHLSKSPDDTFAIKAKRYHDRYVENLNLRLVSIDSNDNGKTESFEAAAVQFIGIRRE